jgi:hypothetical protein
VDARPGSDGIDRCLVSHPASTPADDEECPGRFGEGLAIPRGWNLESGPSAGACPPGHVPARYSTGVRGRRARGCACESHDKLQNPFRRCLAVRSEGGTKSRPEVERHLAKVKAGAKSIQIRSGASESSGSW